MPISPLVFGFQLPRLFFYLTYLNANESRGAKSMPSFNQDQAASISYVVRTLRPGWNHGVIMQILGGLALQGKPVADVVVAAFKAAQDPKATAPTAITFEQYWAKATGSNTDNGVRMCGECLERKPLGHMTTSRPPFTCRNCATG